MGPGPDLYSFWGHSAVRVVDPVKGDLVYNFGSVDFSGNFFMRMVRGEVEAFVGVSSYDATERSYIAEDRTFTRRVLDLTPAQAESVATHLERYLHGDRHSYVYHHFKDNCVTRVADEIDRAVGGELSREARTIDSGRTLRDEALGAIRRNGLWMVAVDLAIAGATDVPITVWQTTFLPRRFDELLDRTILEGRPLVKEKIEVYRSKTIDENAQPIWPWIHVYLFLLLPICGLILWRPRAGAMVFGLFVGLLGFALFLLWAPTNYDFTHHNWNVLILPLTHALFAFGARKSAWIRWAPRLRAYAFGHLLLLLAIGVLHLVSVIHQSVGPALGFAIPPVLLLTGKIRKVHSVTP